MKTKIILLGALLMSFSSLSRAGSGSHGGDAVVCYANNSAGLLLVQEIKEDYYKGIAPFEFDKYPERLKYMTSIQTYDQWFAK